MQILTNITQFFTNLILAGVLFGIVGVASMSLYALSPRPYVPEYEYTAENYSHGKGESVLEIQDFNKQATNSSSIKFMELVDPSLSKRVYNNDSGGVMKITLYDLTTLKMFNIAELINSTAKSSEYLVRVWWNSDAVRVSVEQDGNTFTNKSVESFEQGVVPITVSPAEFSRIGLRISPIDTMEKPSSLDIEIEIIER